MTAAAIRSTPDLPAQIEKVHIIGICGTAMAALAGMLQTRGIEVVGSDAMAYPPVSTLLAEMGIEIQLGYQAQHVDSAKPDLVVVGNVCRRDNPEAMRTVELGLPHMSLPEVLRLVFMRDKVGLVVTGTHGKTTTSSLLAWMLEAAGFAPSYLIGGIPANFASNYLLGEGAHFLVEGDEYDTAYFDKVPKFWHYPATFATINNIEFDHADIYQSIDEIQWVFDEFASQVSQNGSLWINGEDTRAQKAAQSSLATVRTFGLGSDNDVSPRAVVFRKTGTFFELIADGESLGHLSSPLWGEHNLRNTLGAVALAIEAGVTFDAIKTSLPEFRGIKKRQEIKGEANGVTVIDDFAHHPTAVRETLRAVRKRYPDRRIWAVFEAKSNTTRRAIFQEDYPSAFEAADRVVLSQPWKKDQLPESERLSIPRLVDDIRNLGIGVELIPVIDDIVEHLVHHLKPNDVVLGLSGSDFGGFHDKLLRKLAG